MPSNANWSPHDGVLYAEQGKGGVQQVYFWIDAGGASSFTYNGVTNPSVLCLQNTAAINASTIITVQVYKWTGVGQEQQLTFSNQQLGPTLSANTVTSFTIPDSGRYRVKLSIQTVEGASANASYAGQFYVWHTCTTPWSLAHHAAQDLLQFLTDSNQFRVTAYEVLLTNIGAEIAMNGDIMGVQLPAGQVTIPLIQPVRVLNQRNGSRTGTSRPLEAPRAS